MSVLGICFYLWKLFVICLLFLPHASCLCQGLCWTAVIIILLLAVITFHEHLLWESDNCHFVLYCLDANDLRLSHHIKPAARGRRNGEIIRLGVWHIHYSFRDVQGLLLASVHNTEYKAPSSCILLIVCQVSLIKVNFEILQQSRPAFYN